MSIRQELKKLPLFPLTAEINQRGNLAIGGCDSLDLAREYGTPLYIFDEAGLRHRCAEFKTEFGLRYPNTTVLYASKAFMSRAIVRLASELGLGLDVVSGGEISVASYAGFPMDRVIFTGLVPLNEYRLDRPRDYAEQKKEGQLKKSLVFTELSPRFIKFVYAFGFFFLGIGIIIILLILYSMLFGYQ